MFHNWVFRKLNKSKQNVVKSKSNKREAAICRRPPEPNLDFHHMGRVAFDTGRGGRQSPQLPLNRPNRTDARGTVQKRTRPTFERQSSQFLCLYDCPSLSCARTYCSLDLKVCKRGVSCDSRKRIFIKTPKLEKATTRRASLRF